MGNHQEKSAAVDGSGKPNLLKFGSFTLHLQRHGLFRENSRVHFTSRRSETLAVLVEHRGQTVAKQRLLDAGKAFDLSRQGKVASVQFKQGKQELWMADFK